jgi:hypothetical protein
MYRGVSPALSSLRSNSSHATMTALARLPLFPVLPALRLQRLALLALALLCPLAGWCNVGAIERMKGTVQVLGTGGWRTASAGETLAEGERVNTAEDSEALIRFTDGALMALRAKTQVQVTRYQYRQDKPKRNASLLQLVTGSFRFVTGLMGKAAPEAVRVTTPTATIGIRGTDFETAYVEERTADTEAGTYTRVIEGGTFMEGADGRRVEVDAGQTGFATSADLVARGLSSAVQVGLIRDPQGIFRDGSFDGTLKNLQQQGVNRLQQELQKQVPQELKGTLPGLLNDIFKR